ncbi:MAG TPA: AraC family transcriptional regulator [Thermoanaerobaculia bacterium]|nr:AraC family transcriptional regulator [Thermoanaerobaculia bacterium]
MTSEPRIEGRGFAIARVQFDRSVQIARHAHEAAHVVLVYASRWHDRAQRPLDLEAGEILFHPAGTYHENRSETGTNLLIAELSRDFISRFGALYGGRMKSVRFHFNAFDDVPERLYDEIICNDAPTALVVEGLLVQMLALGARTVGSENRQPEWLARVASHIHLHVHQPLSVSVLAEVGSVSQSRLSHGFREHTGKSVTAYIREYRLRIAARALRQTHRSIKDIALNYGFYDHAHFSREFVKMHGLPPIEYRRRTRLQAVVDSAQSLDTSAMSACPRTSSMMESA